MIYIYIFTIIITTYLIRMIPLVLFKKKITNVYVKSFLYYVPYSCLAIMSVPSIFDSTASTLSATIGFITAILVSLISRNLMVVAFFTVISVYIAQMFI